jgi:cbb3-type cytochrome oxidase subunit 1
VPTLTRWFIKTAFIYLGLALVAGILLALQSEFNLSGLGGVFPVYIHLLVFGWLTQLIFGVIYWMFPKFTVEKPRRSGRLGWWTYALLNVGLLLRAVAEPIQSIQANPVSGWGLVAAALLQFLAGLAFVVNSWSRVKEK